MTTDATPDLQVAAITQLLDTANVPTFVSNPTGGDPVDLSVVGRVAWLLNDRNTAISRATQAASNLAWVKSKHQSLIATLQDIHNEASTALTMFPLLDTTRGKLLSAKTAADSFAEDLRQKLGQ